MKNIFLLILGIFLLGACNNQQFTINDDSDYKIVVTGMDKANDAGKVFFRFNILDKKTNEIESWDELKKEDVEILSAGKYLTIENLQGLVNSEGQASEDILVSLLVDRSIRADEMTNVREAINNIVNSLPKNTVYISFLDEQLRKTKKITPENFDEFQEEFVATRNKKILFDAALKKLQELCGEDKHNLDQELRAKIENDAVKKYLVLLTDGKVDENNYRTADQIQRFSEYVQALDGDANNQKRVEIHAIRFGELTEDVDFTLSFLCVDIRNADVRGGLYIAAPGDFISKLKVNNISCTDYELTISYPKGKIEYGEKTELAFRIQAKNKVAYGQVEYVNGTLIRPVKAGGENLESLQTDLIKGSAVLVTLLLLLLLIIPVVRYISNANFNKKYVRKYSLDDDTIIQCHYCLDVLKDGDEIVTKCHHTVHKQCWIQNGYKCADFGEKCKEGKQYFFDVKKPLNKKNRPIYMKWALYGMAGGIIAGLIFQLTSYLVPDLFEPVTAKLLEIFHPDFDKYPVQFLLSVFQLKINSLLLAGSLLGFILVFFFSNLNRYRQRSRNSMAWILLKGLLGVLSGFLAGLIGAILYILCKADANSILIDWIPWMLLGCFVCLCISMHSNTVFKHFLLGTLVSGFVCFAVLFTGKWIGFYAVWIAFTFFGVGTGIAFIASRRIVKKYFLKYKGKESGKIAIHKWMSVAGGSRDVIIGKSANCTIPMRWDEHPSIQAEHAKLYVDRKDQVPCLKVLADGLMYNRKIANTNDEFLLKPGAKFKIGNTVFKYTEK